MQIIANFWYIWIIVLVIALIVRSFLLHEMKQGDTVKAVVWNGVRGILYASVALAFVGAILRIALFIKGA